MNQDCESMYAELKEMIEDRHQEHASVFHNINTAIRELLDIVDAGEANREREIMELMEEIVLLKRDLKMATLERDMEAIRNDRNIPNNSPDAVDPENYGSDGTRPRRCRVVRNEGSVMEERRVKRKYECGMCGKNGHPYTNCPQYKEALERSLREQ